MESGTDIQPSSTLWAVPSKEWIIQPKPKPGRKPKKEASQSKGEEDTDGKGRRIQNRAAQRAFRERKQSQLAELQARIQQYEQGEVERSVALQKIAKRLKDENETLRRENLLLRQKMVAMEQECGNVGKDGDKKRCRETSPTTTASNTNQRKKTKKGSESPKMPSSSVTASYLPSPPSFASSPEANDMTDHFSPLSYDPHHDTVKSTLPPLLDLSGANIVLPSTGGFSTFDCGFCNEDTPCVCREIAVVQANDQLDHGFIKSGDYSQISRADIPPVAPGSILSNMASYQPAVSLRRKSHGQGVNTIFPILPPTQLPMASTSIATCSGDPRNCLACVGDTFGRAFCTAIEDIISNDSDCLNCPHEQRCNEASSTYNQSVSCGYQSDPDRRNMIPTSDAWRRIQEHPNASFADLTLLAEVVSRRSKCAEPRVMISPPPERIALPPVHDNSYSDADRGAVLLTDPHAHFREKQKERVQRMSPPLRLVPEEALIRCAQRRVREVPADGVRDALRLLDAKFAQP